MDRSWAIGAAVFGQLTTAYANFANVRAAQAQARSQASALSHRARMLQLDRRAAERQAMEILQQGQAEIANLTLAGGQRRAEIEASTAAAGVEAGVGSAAEVQASERLIQDVEAYHINLSSVRAASAARRGAVAIDNEARGLRTSARNLRRGARYAAPESALLSGIAGAGLSAGSLYNYRRA